MEFAEMWHWHKERPDLPVSLLMVLHALWLELKKSMELTASSHCSWVAADIPSVREEASGERRIQLYASG